MATSTNSNSRESNAIDLLISHREKIADLERRIKNRRIQVTGIWGTPILALLSVLAWVGVNLTVWLHRDTPSVINGTFVGVTAVLAIGSVVQFFVEFDSQHWEDSKTSLRELKLRLALAQERHVLDARRHIPPTADRQASYREKMPEEIVRLRNESRHYRRLHLAMQWLLFIGSAAVSGVTAWYDPPQPGKGILIVLGATVTVVTAATGYFKPRERAFNLQQTADTLEQHTTAFELGISPYTSPDEKENLRLYATTVEGLRAEQRMREQQLDQPQQGQHQVI
ncbi:DUF4231 domain-containing protein [Streptomyces sp. NPDC002644]